MAKPFFECNLPRPEEIPQIYEPDLLLRMKEVCQLIRERHVKLENALHLAQAMDKEFVAESFQRVAKGIFDMSNENFDRMDAEELAKLSYALWDHQKDDPRIEEWDGAEVLYDTWFVSNKHWETLRHLGIGGSDSSVPQGCNHYQTRQGLFHDKRGTPEKIIDHSKKAIFDRGHYIEDAVVNTHCRITGSVRIRETRMLRSKKYPHCTANIDAIIRQVDGTLAIFEAKTALPQKKGDWAGEKIPPNYITQMRQYAGVLDDDRIVGIHIGMLPTGDITLDGAYLGSAWDAGDYTHHFLERDRDEEQRILRENEAFWNDYIALGIEPDASGDPVLDKEVANRYKETPLSEENHDTMIATYDSHKELLDQLRDAERKYGEVKKLIEAVETKRDNLRNQVIDVLGSHEIAKFTDEDGKVELEIKNKVIRKTSFDSKKMKEYYPDAYEACRKESAYTKFSIKAGGRL